MDKKPERVLQVLGRLDRGGAEVMVMNYYRHIDRTQVQFDFLIHTTDSCDFTDEILALGGKIYSIPQLTVNNYFDYRVSLHRFFEANASRYIAVHGHMGRTAAIYLSIAKKYGLFTIAHSHGTGNTRDLRGFIYKIMAFPTRYVADSFFGCSFAAGRARYGNKVASSSRFSVLPNAFDVPLFRYNGKVRKEIRKELGFEGELVIGHVGRMMPVKNHRFMLEILQRLIQHGMHAKLLLVGDGPSRAGIEQAIVERDLVDRVVCVGSQPDIPKYLQAMDLFLFPSLYEGLGSAVVEAQSAGLPCIVSDVVPDEVAITDLVRFASLSNSADRWALILMEMVPTGERTRYNDEVGSSGYDIVQASQFLMRYYKERGCPDGCMHT